MAKLLWATNSKNVN